MGGKLGWNCYLDRLIKVFDSNYLAEEDAIMKDESLGRQKVGDVRSDHDGLCHDLLQGLTLIIMINSL